MIVAMRQRIETTAPIYEIAERVATNSGGGVPSTIGRGFGSYNKRIMHIYHFKNTCLTSNIAKLVRWSHSHMTNVSVSLATTHPLVDQSPNPSTKTKADICYYSINHMTQTIIAKSFLTLATVHDKKKIWLSLYYCLNFSVLLFKTLN